MVEHPGQVLNREGFVIGHTSANDGYQIRCAGPDNRPTILLYSAKDHAERQALEQAMGTMGTIQFQINPKGEISLVLH